MKFITVQQWLWNSVFQFGQFRNFWLGKIFFFLVGCPNIKLQILSTACPILTAMLTAKFLGFDAVWLRPIVYGLLVNLHSKQEHWAHFPVWMIFHNVASLGEPGFLECHWFFLQCGECRLANIWIFAYGVWLILITLKLNSDTV